MYQLPPARPRRRLRLHPPISAAKITAEVPSFVNNRRRPARPTCPISPSAGTPSPCTSTRRPTPPPPSIGNDAAMQPSRRGPAPQTRLTVQPRRRRRPRPRHLGAARRPALVRRPHPRQPTVRRVRRPLLVKPIPDYRMPPRARLSSQILPAQNIVPQRPDFIVSLPPAQLP